jgi:hypothetical protein
MLLALALVLIVGVDGSGSRWHIPRYQYVASLLNRAGLGMSLSIGLPPARRQARPTVFDIELLAGVAQSGDRATTRLCLPKTSSILVRTDTGPSGILARSSAPSSRMATPIAG